MHALVYYLPHTVFLWFYGVIFTYFIKHLFLWTPSKLYLVKDKTKSLGHCGNYSELSAGKSISITGSFQGTWALFTLFTWFREKLYIDEPLAQWRTLGWFWRRIFTGMSIIQIGIPYSRNRMELWPEWKRNSSIRLLCALDTLSNVYRMTV